MDMYLEISYRISQTRLFIADTYDKILHSFDLAYDKRLVRCRQMLSIFNIFPMCRYFQTSHLKIDSMVQALPGSK